MASAPLVFWFRQDLRLRDHPGLCAAAASGRPVIPLYILDDESPGLRPAGSASRWWLHHSLAALTTELRQQFDIELILRRGASGEVLHSVLSESGASAVYCSRQYEPWAAALEQSLYQQCQSAGIEFKRFPGTLLFEPGSVLTGSGDPYKVFTPFWRACRERPEPDFPRARPDAIVPYAGKISSDSLARWLLTPSQPDWASGFGEHWLPGEEGAADKLARFLGEAIGDYAEGRDYPNREAVSRLSPHLHFGEVTPRTLWHAARRKALESPELSEPVDKFLAEIGWREFAYQLLHSFPNLTQEPFKPPFRHFPWRGNAATLKAWQQGQTGYPLVDAGMRELWQTGYMHNRVRMVAASFLTKHLLVHWREGEAWFWDTLVDADLANNVAGWQWVAGSGADAAPYFRIFNPCAQGEKFDRQGDYVRRWVPELARLPDKYLHRPFDAPPVVLEQAGVILGEHYPLPVVEHQAARKAALAAYDELKAFSNS